MTSQEVSLQVIQQAIGVLADWAKAQLPDGCQVLTKHQAVTKAKELLSWGNDTPISYLELLFDAVKFPDSKHGEAKKHYCPAVAIDASENSYPPIPYPLKASPDLEPPDLEAHQKIVKKELENIQKQDWQNLSLLTLILEKYGSCLSFGEKDIALIDMVRSTAAVAWAIDRNPAADNICLIAGDLSGIQNFIYTISSDGALKSLRARSFYLELVAEEIVQQLLDKLNLPRTSIIYAGGGNLYLLAPATENTKTVVAEVQATFNKWLLGKFQAKIFLALAVSEPFPAADVANAEFAKRWDKAIKEVNKQKSRKFFKEIGNLLDIKVSYEQKCRVCHRDDTEDLDRLNRHEEDSVLACPICREMFDLGSELLKLEVIIRSSEQQIQGTAHTISFDLPTGHIYYHIFSNWQQIIKDADTALLVNDWEVRHYQFRHFRNAVPLLLGNYARESIKEPGKTMRAGELAEKSDGIKRVGYLRMDVDNLGKIFAKGLGNKHSLPRLAGLSRQMSYFFKTYLNSLAKNREMNFRETLKNAKYLTQESRSELVFIYAGGDDLFISGAWNQIIEFAFDVYQTFRSYTGNNPDITLSGGISIDDVKFPLYQAASESGEAEEAAKGNGRDSLGLFGEVFKWDEWLGTGKVDAIEETNKYLSPEKLPSLLGILPFVKKLSNIDTNYSRSFVRNLLNAAQVQNQMIKEIKEKRKQPQYRSEEQDIRYYLHLPKVAYTLARLPDRVLDDEEFRKSLKSPYNAPYFQAIATWIELLTRKDSHDSNND
ncbi:MAG: type III-A CRISPR-associated protein Cas10/Csm1 [Oscillatoriaceae cyanobacterium Prado104]|jgi:CRISPR-associated protein Csm1|nr:type III-A CRISPR-associated protein Cas10/Csm1 [Oscillatoriaceae cyanobacterium Prado104]